MQLNMPSIGYSRKLSTKSKSYTPKYNLPDTHTADVCEAAWRVQMNEMADGMK
jgi:hypothetical protein